MHCDDRTSDIETSGRRTSTSKFSHLRGADIVKVLKTYNDFHFYLFQPSVYGKEFQPTSMLQSSIEETFTSSRGVITTYMMSMQRR